MKFIIVTHYNTSDCSTSYVKSNYILSNFLLNKTVFSEYSSLAILRALLTCSRFIIDFAEQPATPGWFVVPCCLWIILHWSAFSEAKIIEYWPIISAPSLVLRLEAGLSSTYTASEHSVVDTQLVLCRRLSISCFWFRVLFNFFLFHPAINAHVWTRLPVPFRFDLLQQFRLLFIIEPRQSVQTIKDSE